MSKEQEALLKQLDGYYNLKRLDEMGKLQNKLVANISKARLPMQDVLMVLTVLIRQIEGRFINALYAKQGTNEEKK